jgi:prophage tail gpP-like protein
MSDNVQFVIDGRQISEVVSYEMDSDLFLAASSFSFECADTGIQEKLQAGALVKAYVNGACALSGIIDRIVVSARKKGISISVSGRDRMGLLCDHFCEDFGETYSMNGKTIKQVAEHLIRTVAYISRSDIDYQDEVEKFDRSYEFQKINPGETVFEVLRRCANGRGLIFYCKPDGTFVFGKPKEKGTPLFHIIGRRKRTSSNNYIEGSFVSDISQCYSKVTVIGQVQGEDRFQNAIEVNCKATANQPEIIVPYYKPMVASKNEDGSTPKREAQRIIEQQRAGAYLAEYTVPGHIQGGNIWKINELCRIDDEIFLVGGKPVKRLMLVYGRTLIGDKKDGPITRIRLGFPGINLNAQL